MICEAAAGDIYALHLWRRLAYLVRMTFYLPGMPYAHEPS